MVMVMKGVLASGWLVILLCCNAVTAVGFFYSHRHGLYHFKKPMTNLFWQLIHVFVMQIGHHNYMTLSCFSPKRIYKHTHQIILENQICLPE